jgi:large subunit ribosomal protein L25
MQTYEIKGSIREKTGKKHSIFLRKQGMVPCVLYGGEKNIHFYAPEKGFKNLVFTPKVYLIKLDLDGDQYQAVVQDIQYHPVSDDVIHVDFKQVFSDREVILNVPLKLTGNSVGILGGGKLRQRRRHMKVKGLISHIPEYLEIDITDVNIGDFIKIQDLTFDNLEILDPPRAMVIGVVSSRLVAKGMLTPEEEEPEEAVEGEEVEGEEGEETPEDSGKAPEGGDDSGDKD